MAGLPQGEKKRKTQLKGAKEDILHFAQQKRRNNCMMPSASKEKIPEKATVELGERG